MHSGIESVARGQLGSASLDSELESLAGGGAPPICAPHILQYFRKSSKFWRSTKYKILKTTQNIT